MKRNLLLFGSMLLFIASVKAQPKGVAALRINEVMASNATTIADEFGGYGDWVEIYNPGTDTVNLAGLYITDNYGKRTKWQIQAGSPLTKVMPQGYLIIWTDGDSTTQGPLHTNFKLSAGGEEIALVMSDGLTFIDSVSFGPQTTDLSYERLVDGTGSWMIMNPTPGYTNNSAGIEDAGQATFQTYPNPSRGLLFITGLPEDVTEIRLTDLTGRTVATIPMAGFNGMADFSGAGTGIFLLQVKTSEGNSYSRKLILY